MGFLRLYLACIVAFSHAGIRSWIDASDAVQFFFVISGYYMALILDGPYKGDPLRFYLNRALRIFPAYWIVASVTLALMFVFVPYWGAARVFSGAYWNPSALFANLFIFGQEIVFLQEHGPQMLIATPVWSVAMELCFYLLAPFLVRVPTIPLAVLTAIGLRYIENRYFMPAQLPLFCVGILLYRVIGKIRWKNALDSYAGALSYPVYLVHYPISSVFNVPTIPALALTAIFAIALKEITEPLEKARARIRATRTKAGRETSSPRTEALTPGSASRTAD